MTVYEPATLLTDGLLGALAAWLGWRLSRRPGAAHPDFIVVILDYGLVMLAWAAAALLLCRPWRGWMLAAIALSVVAAVAQQMRWDPAPTFNHNDLYHVIQALALNLFYRAATIFAGLPP